MKGYLFKQDATEARFYVNSNGTICKKYHHSFIGCYTQEPDHAVHMLKVLILNTPFSAGSVTASRLNEMLGQ